MLQEQLYSIDNNAEEDKEVDYIYKRATPLEVSSDILVRGNRVFEYRNRKWGPIIKSYLVDNEDGTISVIDAHSEDDIIIATYDLDFNLLATKRKHELEKFGAFYKGEDGHYILFGQDNTDEDDNKEVYRIVKYSFDFERIGAASVKGGESYTTVPFSAGTTRLAQKGKELVIHTSRTRYLTEDGLNHQSNMTIKVNTENMSVTFVSEPFPNNHVSHSFNQFVLFDGDMPAYLDHSDGFPSRGIVLTKESNKSYFDKKF